VINLIVLMQKIKWLLFIYLSIAFVSNVSGQYLAIIDGENISNMIGDEVDAQWSTDGSSLLFQSKENENSIICIYHIETDTLQCTSNIDYNFNNLVWHPDGDKIVFDSDKNGIEYLYVLDLETNEIKPLFNRKIRCRNASFSESSRQVYFTGYDELAKRWEIYSYDFIYDNLNKLTSFKLGCSNPEISNNGKLIAYCKQNPFKGTKSIDVINWYGESVISFKDFDGDFPTWNPSTFKIFFISYIDNKEGELYSIWKNGTHLERLTDDTLEIQSPSISPDESKIAVSVLTENGWDIYVVLFDE